MSNYFDHLLLLLIERGPKRV